MGNEKMTRREFLARAGAGAAGACLGMVGASRVPAQSPRPNIIFILTDDHRWDTLGCMGHPFLQTPNIDRIAAEGAKFTNAFVTTSLCSPSRASFLTGKYVHTHGIKDNGTPFPASLMTFPRLLQQSGYETAYVGKWHMGTQDIVQPGFNRWVSFVGQGDYNDQTLNVDGASVPTTGYLTDILTDYAVEWIARSRTAPFCLYLAHKAAHGPYTPAPRHANLYSDATVTLPANANYDMKGKPKWLAYRSPLPSGESYPATWNAYKTRVLNYCRTLVAVDESVGRIFSTLQSIGKLDSTLIIFAGDNGFLQGSHGLGDKRAAYEESIRIPFLARYPALISPGRIISQMCLNIDLAPTLLDVAGVSIPSDMQGRSFKPLLAGESVPWREDFLYEYFIDSSIPDTPRIRCVRTAEWKYIEYPEIHDIPELYHLSSDPLEMTNLANSPSHAAILKALRARLVRLTRETGGG